MFLVVLILPVFIGALALAWFAVVIAFWVLVSLYYMIGWPLTKWAFSVLWKGAILPFRLLKII